MSSWREVEEDIEVIIPALEHYIVNGTGCNTRGAATECAFPNISIIIDAIAGCSFEPAVDVVVTLLQM